MSAYLLVSLHSYPLNPPQKKTDATASETKNERANTFATHEWWDRADGWKNILNNLRLVMQAFVFFNLLKPWLKVFPISSLSEGFAELIAIMNRFAGAIPNRENTQDSQFSSA